MNHSTEIQPRRVKELVRATAFAIMLVFGLIISASGALAGSAPASTTPLAVAQTQTGALSVADVAERANPAVVTISNLQPVLDRFSGGQSNEPMPIGKGSGYIIDAEGHIVTNSHVVAGGAEFEVEFYDGTTMAATLVGNDPFQDVAVLKLDLSDGQDSLSPISFGDSDVVRPGDEVVAMGTPYGEFTNTVSDGIVGAVDRSLPTDAGYRLPNLIQHDAPIYQGNSGGPLLNMQGEVIGMNVAKAMPQLLGGADDGNFGFAITSNAVQAIVEQLIATGEINRPYLGIRGQAFADGQSVVSVEPNSPADEAGLEDGDVITAIDGQSITERNPFINLLIFDHEPGDTVELTLDRNGAEQNVTVTLAERPAETQ